MLLKTINIENFKNLKKFSLNFDVINFEFHAKNAFGKSSIADAIHWVFTDKLLSGSCDITSIKPKDNPKAVVSVELIFDNDFSLRKEYKENWVHTRGTTDKKLEGHTTTCYINGINIQCSKFDEELRKLFNINFTSSWKGNIFQLLIDILYFGTKMTMQERRQLVIDFVGDVSDQDVFKSVPKLLPLQKYLIQASGKFENVKKVLANNLKDLKEKEIQYNSQISMAVERSVTKEEFNMATLDLQTINNRIQELRDKKFQGEKDLKSQRMLEIANLKSQLSELKQTELETYNKSIQAQQEQLQTLRNEKYDFNKELTTHNQEMQNLAYEKSKLIKERNDLKTTASSKLSRMNALKEEWERVNRQEFINTSSLICPHCGHDLNADTVQKHLEEFNLQKSNSQALINKQGKQIKAEYLEANAQIEELNQKELELTTEYEEMQKQLADFNARAIELNRQEQTLTNSIPTYTQSLNIKALEQQILELEHTPVQSVDSIEIEKEIGSINLKKSQYQSIIDTYNAELILIKRAEEIEKKLNETMQSIAEFESLQDLLTQFIKTKLELLNGRVAAVFGDIKFQLVENNIKEGSWNEVCYVLDGDVAYHNTNSAAKIRLGIRVIEAIKKHLGITNLFYLIDNAEQITDRRFNLLTDRQTIAFVAEDVEPQKAPINLFDENLFN